jgi:hypothetical protein
MARTGSLAAGTPAARNGSPLTAKPSVAAMAAASAPAVPPSERGGYARLALLVSL